MPSVLRLNVVMLSVVAPQCIVSYFYASIYAIKFFEALVFGDDFPFQRVEVILSLSCQLQPRFGDVRSPFWEAPILNRRRTENTGCNDSHNKNIQMNDTQHNGSIKCLSGCHILYCFVKRWVNNSQICE
jgi:hypothetical protein